MAKTQPPKPPALLSEGPFDGAYALPPGATRDEQGLELSVPYAAGVAIYQRTGLDSPAWRFSRSEPVYR